MIHRMRHIYDMIRVVTEMFVAGDDPVLKILQKQWVLASRHLLRGPLTLTGVGFFYEYCFPDLASVPRLPVSPKTRIIFSDIGGEVGGQSAFFILYIENGLLNTLEGVVLDEWPKEIGECELYYLKRSGLPDRDLIPSEERDLKRLREENTWPDIGNEMKESNNPIKQNFGIDESNET
jgi:hypothetical protein